MNKELLKKHHFWILAGLIPLLVLIAVVLINSQVGAAIEVKKKEISTQEAALKSKMQPKSDPLIADMERQRAELEQKRTEMWKDNWERQIGVKNGKQDTDKNLLRWPLAPKLVRFNYTAAYATDPNQLKFGAPIPDPNFELAEFTRPEYYLAEFSNARPGVPGTGMADRVIPTQFNGGWEKVLRHVSAGGWGEDRPRSEQIWLAIEDICVQRAILGQIKAVNDQVSAFAVVPPATGTAPPLHRTFANRVWSVELKVTQRPSDNRYVITGTLTNLSDRLQPIGNGNIMTLNVWLSGDPSAQPVPFRIGGEFVPGKGAAARTVKQDGKDVSLPGNVLPVVQTDDHVLPAGIAPTEIARVEQVLDTRTVPVRRIEKLVLGYKDSRHAAVKLEAPAFWPKAAEKAATGTDPSGMGALTPPPGTAPPGGGASTGAGGATSGSVVDVIDNNRARYIKVTAQVRRMPVAICVVTDQAYVQDVLLAFANSPLRFQTTQVHWQRFRGSLGGTTSGGGSGSPVIDDSPRFAPGIPGAGLGGFQPTIPGKGPGPVAPPPPGGRLSTTMSESQLTSGLVEVTVYGIVSLYEKYDPTGAASPAGEAPANPAGMPPAVPAPAATIDPADPAAPKP